jgi:hypothetical protein
MERRQNYLVVNLLMHWQGFYAWAELLDGQVCVYVVGRL